MPALEGSLRYRRYDDQTGLGLPLKKTGEFGA